jgi:hypothetical protein
MVKQAPTAEILFSLEQANAMLPLLRLIVADISLAHRELSERRLQLHRLVRRGDRAKAQIYHDEVEDTRADLRVESDQLEELIRELENLGVILRSAYDGIVNFPMVMRDQAAYYDLDLKYHTVLSSTSATLNLAKETVRFFGVFSHFTGRLAPFR